MISKSIFSNYLGSILGLFVSKGLRFVAVALCIRLVGDYSWGQVVSTLAIFTFLGLLVDQGLGSSVLLYRIHDRSADTRLMFLILTYRLAVAVFLILCIQIIHAWIHPLDILFRLYSLVLILRAVGLDWWYQRRELYQVTLYLASARTIVFFGLVLFFIKPGSGALTIVLFELVSEAFAIGLGLILRSLGARRTESNMSVQIGFRDLIVFSFPFLLIGILNTIQGISDVLLIRFFSGNTVVAEFDVGAKIGFLYFFMGASVIQILRPKLTRFHLTGDHQKLARVLRSASGILLFLSGAFLIPALYFSREILNLLFKFDRDLSVFTFRWIGLWVGISFFSMLCADTLLSLGQRRKYIQGAILCATVNILTNLALIKLYPGYGAVIAKIAAEAAFAIFAYKRLPDNLRKLMAVTLGFQVMVIIGLVTVYLISSKIGIRPIGFTISVAAFAAVIHKIGLFTKTNLTLLKEN